MRGDRPVKEKLRIIGDEFTPHARGSTPRSAYLCPHRSVYPACAGIDRLMRRSSLSKTSLPRMRGDRPELRWDDPRLTAFTPHARGSTVLQRRHIEKTNVYPACAGIDPLCTYCYEDHYCLPRMRGDRPDPLLDTMDKKRFTPHARGSTIAVAFEHGKEPVYPACAGIDLREGYAGLFVIGLPRMRGDRPCLPTWPS